MLRCYAEERAGTAYRDTGGIEWLLFSSTAQLRPLVSSSLTGSYRRRTWIVSASSGCPTRASRPCSTPSPAGDATVAPHPFSTTESEIGVAHVPDERLDALAELSKKPEGRPGRLRGRRHRRRAEVGRARRGWGRARDEVPERRPGSRRRLLRPAELRGRVRARRDRSGGGARSARARARSPPMPPPSSLSSARNASPAPSNPPSRPLSTPPRPPSTCCTEVRPFTARA